MLDYAEVAVPIMALAINMIVQLSVARDKPRWGYLRSVVLGFGAGLVSLFALAGLTWFYGSAPWQERIAMLLVNLGTYLGLAVCFFALVNLNKTSLRIRLFKELQQSRGGLSLEQLKSLYDDRRVFELRVTRLLNNRQVIKRDGRYFLVGYTVWLIANVVHIAKLVVMGRGSEFAQVPARKEYGAGAARDELQQQSPLPE
jgi:hypothetical protein